MVRSDAGWRLTDTEPDGTLLVCDNQPTAFSESLIIYSDHSSLICIASGRIGSCEHGFYFPKYPFLSHLGLTVEGRVSQFVSANTVGAASMILYQIMLSRAGAQAGPRAS
jgi:hypothetical protein